MSAATEPVAERPARARRPRNRRDRLFVVRQPATPTKKVPSGHDTRDLMYDAFVQHPGQGADVGAILAAFRAAEAGSPRQQCDLFDDLIEPDCHLASLFEKRSEAVAGKDWVIQSGIAGAEPELAAHVLRTCFDRLPMIEVYQHLLTFNRYGWAAAEIDWDIRIIDGREWIVPVWFEAVRARRFLISTMFLDGVNNELKLYADVKRPRGDFLRPDKWVVVRRDPAVPLACAGLMRNCAWPALGKRYGFRDWLIYSDKYGKPLPIASYQEGADDEAKDIAEEIIQNIGNDIGAIKPDTISVDFVEPKSGNGGDNSRTHGGLIQHCNSEMSKRVNGSTLTNDNTGAGSYGLGDVHDAVRWEAVQYDAARLEAAFNLQVFEPFCRFNGIKAPPPMLKIQVVRDLDPTTRVDVATKFKNLLGGKLSEKQMRQEFGFREPTDDKDSLPGVAMPMPATPEPATKEQR